MNYFQLIADTWIRKAGESLDCWGDIDDSQNKVLLELNDCLKDLWLSYSYLFKTRKTTLQTVAGQQAYNLPFDGILADDGVMVQIPANSLVSQSTNSYRNLIYSEFVDNFYADNKQAQPDYYTIYDSKLVFYPVPDKTYNLILFYDSNNWALSVATLTQQACSGQNILYVSDATVFNPNDNLYINRYNSTEESGIIQSINNNSVILAENLAFTHNLNERITKEKQSLDYENDEPNFPSEYHNILSYMALKRLFYSDPERYKIYANAFSSSLQNIIVNSEFTQKAGQKIRTTYTNWLNQEHGRF